VKPEERHGDITPTTFLTRRQLQRPLLTFLLDSAHDCNYLQIDRATTAGDNPPHVLGTSILCLQCPEPHFRNGFLAKRPVLIWTKFDSPKEKSPMKLRFGCVAVGFLSLVLSLAAQTSSSSPASARVPPLIQFSNVATDEGGTALSGSAGAASGSPTLSGGGKKDYLPLWLSSSKLGSSKLFESTTGDVGIGTTTPAATLDVNGTVNAATSFNLGGTSFAFGSYANGNAFLGFAGNSSTASYYNTAVGYQALLSNTTGSQNSAMGYQNLPSNTTGSQNTAMGYQNLLSNTTGSGNVAIGIAALSANTTGDLNIAIGTGGLTYNTTGSGNTVVGFGMYINTTGSGNTSDGGFALYANTTGNYNTASGNGALFNSDRGSYNTAIGYNAGRTANSMGITTNNNTAVGASAYFGRESLTNATAIGANAEVSESNALVLGCVAGVNGCASNVHVGIATTKPSNIFTIAQGAGQALSDGWATYSSRRWKTNIHTLDGALSKVEQLRGVSYDLEANGKHEVGVIAEEVGAVVPEVVSYDENGKDARGVDYSRLTALLIEAVKQQQREIRDLKSELRTTRQTLQKVKAQVAAIQPTLVAAK
jgi:hypothetical protein